MCKIQIPYGEKTWEDALENFKITTGHVDMKLENFIEWQTYTQSIAYAEAEFAKDKNIARLIYRVTKA